MNFYFFFNQMLLKANNLGKRVGGDGVLDPVIEDRDGGEAVRISGLTASGGTKGGSSNKCVLVGKRSTRVTRAGSVGSLRADADEVLPPLEVSIVVSSVLVINDGDIDSHQILGNGGTEVIRGKTPARGSDDLTNGGLLSGELNGANVGAINLKSIIDPGYSDVIVDSKGGSVEFVDKDVLGLLLDHVGLISLGVVGTSGELELRNTISTMSSSDGPVGVNERARAVAKGDSHASLDLNPDGIGELLLIGNIATDDPVVHVPGVLGLDLGGDSLKQTQLFH